jgi:hypothetical protein
MSDVVVGWETTGWQAVAGTLRIEVTDYANCRDCPWPDFLVVATVTGGVFQAPDGRRVRAARSILVTARGGRGIGGGLPEVASLEPALALRIR